MARRGVDRGAEGGQPADRAAHAPTQRFVRVAILTALLMLAVYAAVRATPKRE